MAVTLACYLGLAGTLYMTGVVWFAQLVHYPLLDRGNSDCNWEDQLKEKVRSRLR